MERLPAPEIVPLKTLLPWTPPSTIVRVWLPSVTAPAPDRLTIWTAEVAPEMSRVPLSRTYWDIGMAPDPDSAKVAPELIVVGPV